MTAVDVGRLPRRTLAAGTRLYRIHRAHLGPWFFDSSPHGRFNPTGISGRGACYWAEDPVAAWSESFRTVMTLTTDDVAARALSSVTLREGMVVHDLTVKRALAAGVTVTTTAGSDYSGPQALADALQGIGGGVRYRSRHDLSGEHIAIAWFGTAGAPSGSALKALPTPTTTALSDSLIDEVRRLFGYLVVPAPV